ncbi:TetR/AcrR family transcriptional regulator [Puia sp.]|jgi:AcrR family transcriptional regulator|uniref:TetR/AcrR family transcriptional regulator n=1 Tax=Puia sp. TaxID=2045100 RepID=UPI002F40CEE7
MRLRDDAKELLIRQKAVELIVREGLDGFSMKELARSCELSVSTIYVYFKNKEDLLFQLTLQLRTEQLSQSIRGLKEDMSFEEGLRLQWQNRFDYFVAHPLNIQAVERLKYTPQFHRTTPQLIKTFQPDLGKFMENAIKRGELAGMPFEVYWAIAFAPLYSLIEFHAAGGSYASDKFRITPELIGEAVRRIAMALRGE